MEDVSKVIEMAVGIILFLIAATIAIVMYNRLYKATENSLYINNMETNVIYNYDKQEEYVFTHQDVYFLLHSIKKSISDEINTNNIFSKLDVGSIVINGIASNPSQINAVISSFKDSDKTYRYKITYEYDDIESINNNANINNHIPKKIIITQKVV